ncbi:hypothetical protein ATZ33_17305 [Enterococcus silesiacus]|uniref:HTH cro/C1-type domain-containing protein n=1 Tax=Enterococcus silesiacus TaxID=332949 RepID=A0A0S3KFL7_9ENTE|nr:helix-turn-helix domain-containing protein [Enterococcus silesiacus]ALS03071.1 hypothetical protein ATZ33_17305 [Enterococcus silesiacus]OJG93015.1 hypothetical protein RV15_GL002149 [Enterococcus silesiacus]
MKQTVNSYLSQLDKGMSNKQLAKKVNDYVKPAVSEVTIKKIKEGKYTPSVTLALALARVLGTTVEQLFVIEGGE